MMTVRMGRKLAELAVHIASGPTVAPGSAGSRRAVPGTYPVGLGVVFAALGAARADAFAVHQYGVATMILSAALRLMRLYYLDTQAILFEVNAAVADDYARVRTAASTTWPASPR